MTAIGNKRKAKNIRHDIAFGPSFESEYSLQDEIDWLRQTYPEASPKRDFLICCENEDYITEVWESTKTAGRNDSIEAFFRLAYKEDKDQNWCIFIP